VADLDLTKSSLVFRINGVGVNFLRHSSEWRWPSDESFTEDGMRRLVFKDHYADLPDYLKGFSYTHAVMRNAENLEHVAFELAEDNLAEGVRYLEVRYAPQNYINDRLDAE